MAYKLAPEATSLNLSRAAGIGATDLQVFVLGLGALLICLQADPGIRPFVDALQALPNAQSKPQTIDQSDSPAPWSITMKDSSASKDGITNWSTEQLN